MLYNKREKALLASLAAAKFTHIIDFMVMMPLGPQLMREFDITAQQFGFLVASYTISAGIAVFISALFIDKFPRKQAIVIAYSGFIVGTLACGFSGTYYLLMIARMLTGIFGGVLNALILSTVGDSFPLEKRAGAMGIVLSAFSSAAAFGVPLGIYLASIGHWNWPFFIIVFVSLPIWLGLYFYVPNSGKKSETANQGSFAVFYRILGNGNQLSALGMSLSLVLGQFMIIPYISAFMVGNIGFTQLQLVYIYLFGGISTLITGPLIGRLADKFGHKKLFLTFAGFSIFPLLLITHLPVVSIPVALVASSLFFIFISGRIIPSVTMVVSSAEKQYRAGFVSVNTAMQQFAAGMAAMISGSVVSEISVEKTKTLVGFHYVGWLAVLLTIVAIFLGSRLIAVRE
jgi:predicted MFS family arabinose efflux permease